MAFQDFLSIPSSGLKKTRLILFVSSLRTGSKGHPETLYLSYNIKPHHIPKELQPQFHHGKSLISHIQFMNF